jgi:signal transduction histidine kinase
VGVSHAVTAPSFARSHLESLTILEGLPEDQLDWFCQHGERVVLGEGQHMFERGEPATAMWIVVRGTVQRFEQVGGQWMPVATTVAGEVTGMLPFSRMTHYPGYTVATEPSEVLRVDALLFREMIDASLEVARRLVAQMSDRVRGDVRLEQQGEKMMALGRLSAGLAHELNNPAAAIGRAASTLAESDTKLSRLVAALVRHDVDDEALERLVQLRSRARVDHAKESALARAEREDALVAWLDGRGVEDAWDVAAHLADGGMTEGDLEDLAGHLPESALSDAIRWVAAGLESARLIGEIGTAANRISALIASIKTYSHMDRSPEHKPTDVRNGIDNTLTMLNHKLNGKEIQLAREYPDDVPMIAANAGQLNQVWTNLIDNAIDAAGEGGSLTLRVSTRDRWVEVEVVDDGPGIPKDIRPRIFEPFFTTKDVGAGTGLGLGIANRIVRTHGGHIEVRSRPGETVMCVRLPIEPTT